MFDVLCSSLMYFVQQLRGSKAARIALLSYLAFASNALCTLITIPLAVEHLGGEQIALWTLVSQLVSYLVWMDLGVGDAIGRKIAGPVASRDQEEIAAWWTLSLGVLAFQGFLMLLVGAALWPLWMAWFDIGADLRPDALWLFSAAVGTAALALPLRAYPGMLLAQQRFAWVPGSQCISPWVQMLAFALCLRSGLGVKSYFFGIIAGQISGWAVLLFAVHSGPVRVRFSRNAFTRTRATDLFRYSGSVAVNGFCQNLLQTLPSVLLGRLGGLPLIPVYGFTARVPELLGNLSQRTTHAFYPGIQALAVRDNRAAFLHKFREVQGLTVSLSLMVAAFILLANRSIISWLAAPDFFAGPCVNLWLALAAITIPHTRSLNHLLQYSGDMGKSALFAILPVILGIAGGWPAFQRFGMAGLAATFALLPLITIAPYAAIRGSRNCGFAIRELCGRGLLHVSLAILLVLLAGWWCLRNSTAVSPTPFLGRQLLLPPPCEWSAGLVLFLLAAASAIHHLMALRRVR
jgi:O-antigen/teichoic acid export membrane protein